MIIKYSAALLLSAAFSTHAFAQSETATEPAPAPVAVEQPAATPAVVEQTNVPTPVEQALALPVEVVLPAQTEVLLRLNDQLSSRNHRQGDTFPLTVVRDVAVNGVVVIPAGTRAMGQVTWRTGRGSFGKSGKLEVTMRYVELNGQRIPISGFHRQEGEGNTGATIGAVAAAGIIGGLVVHGRTAIIPQGREFTALTVDAIPVTIAPEGTTPRATIAAAYTPSAVGIELGKRRDREEEAREQREENGRGSR